MTDLSNKVAVITGAGQGVGKGIALALAKAGAYVSISGRTLSKVEDTLREIEKSGGQGIALECEVTNLEHIEKCIEVTVEQFNSIDILVNNAQIVPLGKVLDVTDESFNLAWKSGPLATHRFMKLSYPYLKESSGSVVNLGTGAAIRPDPKGFGAYTAVKEAIRALSRAAAVEWGIDGIRVNTIIPLANSPGMEMWEKMVPEEAKAFKETIPLARIGDCEEDIGEAVVALVGPQCKYITGATLTLDGGHAHLR
tara:strand:+ start:171 stop:929 length:759 start_codon:yes stop_codon:yes gene_type:complete